jgi:hypothetical protein
MRSPSIPARDSAQDLATSNSLADLAARILAEHEAAETLQRQSLERAINAGSLLLEAKARLKHGTWLPWLKERCQVPVRTAQFYMQLANHQAEIRNGVAHMTVRDAAALIANPTPEIRHLKHQAERAKFTLETPQALLPSATGRKMRVARNSAKRQWMLAIGPDVSRATMKERERLARQDERVQQLQQEHDDLKHSAASLEQEAEELRKHALSIETQINHQVSQIIGPAHPFTETYNFQINDEAIDAEIAALSDNERVARLLEARGSAGGPISEIKRGYWGDLTLISSQSFPPGPGGGWTGLGSPEWLDELFPSWNEPDAGAAS